MRRIIYLFIMLGLLHSGSLPAQSYRKLTIKNIQPAETVSVQACGNARNGYLIFITELHGLKFDVGEYDILRIDTTRTQVEGYILCIGGDKIRDFSLTVSDGRYEETCSAKLTGWYKIERKDDVLKTLFHSRNNYLAIEAGKGFSYSPTGGGLGMSLEYRFGEKIGWGVQIGGGYYSVDAPQRFGVPVTAGTYSETTTILPHFSAGIKCYPLLRIKEQPLRNFLPSLARNFYVGVNYGILGSEDIGADNDDNGNFSLGGRKTMHGISVLVGENWLFPIDGNKNNGIIVNGGIGFAYSSNLKSWMFAYDVGIGWYWRLNRNRNENS